jgi:hypothetical protein
MADESGYVNREIVIDILRRHGVGMSPLSGAPEVMILIKGDKIDARPLSDEVSRCVLRYLTRRFNIPIHHFYTPLMAPKLPDEKIQ